MGKVFTWEEIAHGRVPDANGFGYIVNRLREELGRSKYIKTSVICGSVVRGDSNLRSDIDCLVIFDDGRERPVFAQLQGLSAVAGSYFVPVTFIPCSSDVAATRMHHLGPSFWQHVERSAHAGGVIKGWPNPVVQENRSKDVELESYLRVKLYSLEEQLAEYLSKRPSEQAHALKKMLEAPIHVARKVLARISALTGDSKAQIQEQYNRELPGMAGQLRALLALDAEYTALLRKQLVSPVRASYLAFIEYLEAHMLDSVAFVKRNAMYVAELPAP